MQGDRWMPVPLVKNELNRIGKHVLVVVNLLTISCYTKLYIYSKKAKQ